EAQDTSPEQWQIVKALASEFFGDAGAGVQARTLFVVGDEKQSIYSFQGADLAQFGAMAAAFADMARQAARDWRRIPLALSFRTVAPVLAAVDRVFADHARTPGLSSAGAIVRHGVHRM